MKINFLASIGRDLITNTAYKCDLCNKEVPETRFKKYGVEVIDYMPFGPPGHVHFCSGECFSRFVLGIDENAFTTPPNPWTRIHRKAQAQAISDPD